MLEKMIFIFRIPLKIILETIPGNIMMNIGNNFR
jgi:hypothetical protein